jgi:predicted transcriptional regulator
MSSCYYKIFKKYLVYLVDYELISYNRQRQVYHIEENGIDLLSYMMKKKRAMMADIEDMMITIKREGGFDC